MERRAIGADAPEEQRDRIVQMTLHSASDAAFTQLVGHLDAEAEDLPLQRIAAQAFEPALWSDTPLVVEAQELALIARLQRSADAHLCEGGCRMAGDWVKSCGMPPREILEPLLALLGHPLAAVRAAAALALRDALAYRASAADCQKLWQETHCGAYDDTEALAALDRLCDQAVARLGDAAPQPAPPAQRAAPTAPATSPF
jgi:hypothetical protein